MQKKFRALEIVAKKYLDAFSSGIHSTFLKDSLVEIDVVREYQPGDRRLDSKSSLKTGRTMSRVFNPERSLNLYIILDLSSSQYNKLEAAVTTALYLCYLGEICGERVGLCAFSDKITSVLEASDDYSSVISQLEKSFNRLAMNKTTCVDDSVKRIACMGLTNSLVVFISDFCYNISDSLVNDIKRVALSPTNSVLNAVLYNPNDWLLSLDCPFKLTFKDAETGNDGCYSGQSVNQQFINWSKNLKSKLLHCNSDAIFLDVKQEQFLTPLIKFLMRS